MYSLDNQYFPFF